MKHAFLLFFLSLSFACSAASPSMEFSADDATQPTASDVYYVRLPAELTFAGERVPLEYPDVRQALEREMSVTMFMHSRTLQTLRAMRRYFPVIEPILKKYGVPEDFKYLAMAESGLNPEAMSSAKAAGMWQLMTSAAKDFGVETGDNVDMRYHIEASTEAAAKYLAAAYKRYGSWTMAAASYNLGLAGVTRRANTQQVESYYDLYMPEETMRYVYRILSMKLVGESPQLYGFRLRDANYLKPFANFVSVEISNEDIDWSALAVQYNTNYKILRMLNPWIRSYQYANKSKKSYTVLFPTKDFRIKGF